jgi:UDP-N-acetyl-D-galactosamine dehydrogenase
MSLYEKLVSRREKLSLVGLGYVGMPIAVAFSKKVIVIGYDLNAKKIELYNSGIDPTNEVGNEALKNCTVEFTADETRLREVKFHIVAVPTPVYDDRTPDLTPVQGASHILGRNLTKGSVVVYESTVYPGVTEDVCVPILEKESGLKCGVDFKIGYSPERINPGDKMHRLETITKIVSGMDDETLDTVAKVYELVVLAGLHRAPCIKVAEAAKVIEKPAGRQHCLHERAVHYLQQDGHRHQIRAGSRRNQVELPEVLSRFGGRALHWCRSILPHV